MGYNSKMMTRLVKKLSQEELEYFKQLPPRRPEKVFENAIKSKIGQYGGIAVKQEPSNSNPFRLPDLLISFNGEIFFIEVKLPHTRLKPDQITSFKLLSSWFHIYICHSWSDLVLILKDVKAKEFKLTYDKIVNSFSKIL